MSVVAPPRAGSLGGLRPGLRTGPRSGLRRAGPLAALPGRRRTPAAALADLPAATWRTRHDVPRADGSRLRLDHVLVGPPGVLVVDAHTWARGSRSSLLRADGARRQRDLDEVRAAAREVAGLLRDDDAGPTTVPVTGVLCAAPAVMVTGWIGDVLVCDTDEVAPVLGGLAERLDPEQVDEVAAALFARLLAVAGSARQAGS